MKKEINEPTIGALLGGSVFGEDNKKPEKKETWIKSLYGSNKKEKNNGISS